MGTGAALLVIDAQQGFADPRWGRRDNPACEEGIRRLLRAWRSRNLPVVLVRHDSTSPDSPLRPGQQGNAFLDGIDGPHDLLVTKSVNSAFYGEPDLDSWLRGAGITQVVICGITTNHCCETTARMAGNLGYEVTFVLDATHTFDRVGPDRIVVAAEDLSRATAASLHGEFASVTTVEHVIASLGA